MLKFALSRVLLLALTVLGVVTIAFVISRIMPGSPVDLMLGAKPTQEQIDEATRELGLDRPLIYQYGAYLIDLVRGDWGTSLRTGQPVLEDIARLLPATVELVTSALFFSILIGIPLGVRAAVREGSLEDLGVRTLTISGAAVPVFVLAILLQVIFHGGFNLFPLQGRIDSDVLLDHPIAPITGFYLLDTLISGNWIGLRSSIEHLALPLITLTIATTGIVFRVTRNTMAESLGADHIRTLRAYGLSNMKIEYGYALRATLIPLFTVIGLTYGYMIGGSIIVEYVFDWPGIGGYIVNAVIVNDYPAVLGVTVVLATSYLTINLLIDLVYYALDPRLRV